MSMEEVDTEHEEYDPELYEQREPLLGCKTLEDAGNFIDDQLSRMTTEEKETVIKSFFGFSNRLMELADLCHDFFDAEFDDEEVSVFMSDNEYILPEHMTIPILRNEKKFIGFMSKHNSLKFGVDLLENPLYGANLLRHFEIKGAFASIEDMYASQQKSVISVIRNNNNRTCSVDIITILSDATNPNIQSFKLNQIAQLCATIRKWMGNNCEFQIDSSDNHLVILLCAMDNLSRQFFTKFKSDPVASIQDISNKLKEAIKNADITQQTTWTARTTDANIFDAANNAHKLQFDARPTGKIFREECGYQIELNGLVDDKKNKAAKFVAVSITDQDQSTPVRLTLANRETTKLVSKQVLAFAIGRQKPTTIKSVGDQILTFGDPLKYALKRAGDWGQVEHCVRYDKVFVTSDKLAAMYAYYRNVRFIYLYRDQHFDFSDVLSVANPLPNIPDCIRYAFTLSRKIGQPKSTKDRSN